MAKITGPLMSISASGSIGKVLGFRATPSGAVVARCPAPYPQNTPNMLLNQKRMRDARATFKELNIIDAADWQALGMKYRMSAWAEFFKEYQAQNIMHPAAPLIPALYL